MKQYKCRLHLEEHGDDPCVGLAVVCVGVLYSMTAADITVHCVSKKCHPFIFVITPSNVDRFL